MDEHHHDDGQGDENAYENNDHHLNEDAPLQTPVRHDYSPPPSKRQRTYSNDQEDEQEQLQEEEEEEEENENHSDSDKEDRYPNPLSMVKTETTEHHIGHDAEWFPPQPEEPNSPEVPSSPRASSPLDQEDCDLLSKIRSIFPDAKDDSDIMSKIREIIPGEKGGKTKPKTRKKKAKVKAEKPKRSTRKKKEKVPMAKIKHPIKPTFPTTGNIFPRFRRNPALLATIKAMFPQKKKPIIRPPMCPQSKQNLPKNGLKKGPSLSSNELYLLSLGAIACTYIAETEKLREGRIWMRKREPVHTSPIVNEMRFDPGNWFKTLKMDEDTYRELLNMVTPLIKKKDTCMRKAISPHSKLHATLIYITTGCSVDRLKHSCDISGPSLSYIIPETLKAINLVLQATYLQFPDTHADWLNIANDFEELWKFPNCLGSIDLTYVRIFASNSLGKDYTNEKKGFPCQILVSLVNAKYEILMCEFGLKGILSEKEAVQETTFFRKLHENKIDLPEPRAAKNSTAVLPFVFLTSQAFEHRNEFLKPFAQKFLTPYQKLFNDKLTTAREVAPSVFRLLSNKYNIFNTHNNMKLTTLDSAIMACCTLHNYLIKKRGDEYLTQEEMMPSPQPVQMKGEEEATPQPSAFLQFPYYRAEERPNEVQELFLNYFATVERPPAEQAPTPEQGYTEPQIGYPNPQHGYVAGPTAGQHGYPATTAQHGYPAAAQHGYPGTAAQHGYGPPQHGYSIPQHGYLPHHIYTQL